MKRPIANLSARMLDAIARHRAQAVVDLEPDRVRAASFGNLVVLTYDGRLAAVALVLVGSEGGSEALNVELSPWFQASLDRRADVCAGGRR